MELFIVTALIITQVFVIDIRSSQIENHQKLFNTNPHEIMKKTSQDAQVRKIDNALSIIDLFDGKDFAFDVVIASLNGDHPSVVNKISDRAYFILEGSGKVTVGDNQYEVEPDDLIVIHAKQPHSLSGNLRYLIITSPPFKPENEEQT